MLHAVSNANYQEVRKEKKEKERRTEQDKKSEKKSIITYNTLNVDKTGVWTNENTRQKGNPLK